MAALQDLGLCVHDRKLVSPEDPGRHEPKALLHALEDLVLAN